MPTLLVDLDDTLLDFDTFRARLPLALADALGASGDRRALAASATASVLEWAEAEYRTAFSTGPANGYRNWLRSMERQTLSRLQCIRDELGSESTAYANSLASMRRHAFPQCVAEIPGARTALAELARDGWRLYTASANDSRHVRDALASLGMQEIFHPHTFGPDLVDVAKEGPEYYKRIMAAIGVHADDVYVIDDNSESLRHAAAAGSHAIRAGFRGVSAKEPDSVPVLTDWRTAPSLLSRELRARHGTDLPRERGGGP